MIFNKIDTEIEVNLNDEQARNAADVLGIDDEDLADILTGHTCDSYADAVAELVEDFEGNCAEARAFDKEAYDRCFAYFRLLNLALTEAEALVIWENDFRAAAQG